MIFHKLLLLKLFERLENDRCVYVSHKYGGAILRCVEKSTGNRLAGGRHQHHWNGVLRPCHTARRFDDTPWGGSKQDIGWRHGQPSIVVRTHHSLIYILHFVIWDSNSNKKNIKAKKNRRTIKNYRTTKKLQNYKQDHYRTKLLINPFITTVNTLLSNSLSMKFFWRLSITLHNDERPREIWLFI